jgi:hypothetical protein
MGTDAERAAELFLQITRRRKMVGVDVRLQNPFDAQPLGFNRLGDGIGGVRPNPSGGGIIVEHASVGVGGRHSCANRAVFACLVGYPGQRLKVLYLLSSSPPICLWL